MRGWFHITGYAPTIIQSYKGAGIPDFKWSKASVTAIVAQQEAMRDDLFDMFSKMSPIVSAIIGNAAVKATQPNKIDWCKLVQPFMEKTLHCDPPIDINKKMNHGKPFDLKPGKGGVPKIPHVDDIKITDFRIT